MREALKCTEALIGNFRLASQQDVLPTWHRRGLPDEMDNPADASSLVRCSPDHDATNGFFVSCFVRNNNASKKRKDIEEERPDGSGSKRKKKKKKSK